MTRGRQLRAQGVTASWTLWVQGFKMLMP